MARYYLKLIDFCWPESDNLLGKQMTLTDIQFLCSLFASFVDVQTTEDGVLSVNSRYMTIKSLTFFYFSNLLACSSLSFAIQALGWSCQRKQGQVWSTLIFKMGIIKHFHHHQTITNNSKLFVSDTPKHKNYFEELRFDHSYGWKFKFPILEFFHKFLHHNNKLSSADIKKEASPSDQDGGIWNNCFKLH